MKVNPLPSGHEGNPSQNIHGLNNGKSASAQKLAAAKAIASGETQINVTQEVPKTEEEFVKEQLNVRKIKMRTNSSPERFVQQEQAPVEQEATETTQEEAVSAETQAQSEEPVKPEEIQQPTPEVQAQEANSNVDEQANVAEDTKPLSPQFAALARQRRALQVEKTEFAERVRAFEAKVAAQPTASASELEARIKSQPLSVLQEFGVTYDQLTEAILNDQKGITPEIQALKAEIKTLKEGFDKQFQDKDAQAEQAALNEMKREAEKLVYTGDTYEMIRATGSIPDVIELIHRTYKKTGEVLDVPEAMQLIEDHLTEESFKLANTSKIKNKLQAPAPKPVAQAATPPAAPAQQSQTQPKQIKTLTNRNNASVPLSRRERAIAAALGQLKK